jgi:hypothetical protein
VRFFTRQFAAVVLATSVLVLATALPAAGVVIRLPKAGTAAQVKKLVAASTSIKKVPKNLYPSLANVGEDFLSFTSYKTPFPGGCLTVGAAHCTFGDTTSKKLVVLFGDSHAWMWLAAVDPILKKEGYKLELLWRPSCPAATLTLYNDENDPSQYDTACNQWRTTIIATIVSQRPVLVLLGERTANIFTAPNATVTNAELQAGLATTIVALKGPHTKVAVIGDVPSFANMVDPSSCMAMHSTNVQLCSTPLVNSNPAWVTLAPGEVAAAKATNATYIDAAQWLCSKGKCSPIVGTMPTYCDWTHISATYSAYLATVMGDAIKPLL